MTRAEREIVLDVCHHVLFATASRTARDVCRVLAHELDTASRQRDNAVGWAKTLIRGTALPNGVGEAIDGGGDIERGTG